MKNRHEKSLDCHTRPLEPNLKKSKLKWNKIRV